MCYIFYCHKKNSRIYMQLTSISRKYLERKIVKRIQYLNRVHVQC